MLEEVSADPRIILFIDELHMLMGAGGAGDDAGMDAANLLKPALARGDFKCIGATTVEEYRRYVEKDAALERRFQPVSIWEPSVPETIEILGFGCPCFLPKDLRTRVIHFPLSFTAEHSPAAVFRGLGFKYEKHHGVKFTPQAIIAAVTLSQRYIADRFLPDKVRSSSLPLLETLPQHLHTHTEPSFRMLSIYYRLINRPPPPHHHFFSL